MVYLKRVGGCQSVHFLSWAPLHPHNKKKEGSKVKVKNTQVQKQDTVVEGANIRVASDTPRYIMSGLLIIGLVLVATWWYTGLIVHVVMIVVAVMFSGAAIVWFTIWLVMTMLQQWYEVQQAKFATHFYAHNDSIIGDRTTIGYRHFHPSIVDGTPNDEDLSVPTMLDTPDTYEQATDRQMHAYHHRDNKSYQEIADMFDPGLNYTRDKVRAGVDRHTKRLREGKTWEGYTH